MSLQTDTSTHLEIEDYSEGDSKSDTEQFLPRHLPPMRVGGDICPASSRHIIAYNGCSMHVEGRKGKQGSEAGRGRRKTISSSLVPRDQDGEEGVIHKGRVH